jgi:hypothetical protein
MSAARDDVAFRYLGRCVWSNRVNCGRCRARRALVEGYDTRAHPFTRTEERLPKMKQLSERARRVVSNFVEVLRVGNLVRGRVSLKVTLALSVM